MTAEQFPQLVCLCFCLFRLTFYEELGSCLCFGMYVYTQYLTHWCVSVRLYTFRYISESNIEGDKVSRPWQLFFVVHHLDGIGRDNSQCGCLNKYAL